MRLNLVKAVEQSSDLTNAIVLTHNIDFLFLQSVILPALKRAGYPKLTIFADASCASDTFAAQAKLIGSIGIRYRVVPVAMEHGFRFHPKAVMLSSQKSGRLYVGSGNLTYGGWIENAEVWTAYDSEADGTSPFSWFKGYLEDVVNRAPFNKTIQAEVEEAFDGESHEWAAILQDPAGFIGKIGTRPPLSTQILSTLGGNKCTNVWICSPFFDDDAEAITDLLRELDNPPCRLFFQNGRTSLKLGTVEKLPACVTITPVAMVAKDADEEQRGRYVHAKFYAFEQEKETIVFAGSANCSRAALRVPGRSGNAEMLSVLRLNRERFKELVLDEFRFLDSPPVFSPKVEAGDKRENPKIQITAARCSDGQILIGYIAGREVKLTDCILDESVRCAADSIRHGEVALSVGAFHRLVRLEGKEGERKIISNLCWIDHERELSSTAKVRFLSETIRVKVRSEAWGLGAWNDVLNIFCKHLEYNPKSGSISIKPRAGSPDSKKITYTEEDVFAEGYGINPLRGSDLHHFSADTQIRSLRQLLLRWFGYSFDQEEDSEDDDPEVGNDEGTDSEAGQKPVIKTEKETSTPKRDLESERERSRKFILKVENLFCSPSYFDKRPPDMIASDTKVMAAMAMVGLRERWLAEADFIKIASRIFAQMFFCSDHLKTMGWLEHRRSATEDPEKFLSAMVSVDISAVLSLWAFLLPFKLTSAQSTRFVLACIISVARFPELWRGGSPSQIQTQIKDHLLPLLVDKNRQEAVLSKFNTNWTMLMRLGKAVSDFEKALAGKMPSDLKDKIRAQVIPPGELLWQGPTGFCVTINQVERSSPRLSKAISLRFQDKPLEVQGNYMIPVHSIIKDGLVDDIGMGQRKILSSLAHTIRKNVAAVGRKWFPSEPVTEYF